MITDEVFCSTPTGVERISQCVPGSAKSFVNKIKLLLFYFVKI